MSSSSSKKSNFSRLKQSLLIKTTSTSKKHGSSSTLKPAVAGSPKPSTNPSSSATAQTNQTLHAPPSPSQTPSGPAIPNKKSISEILWEEAEDTLSKTQRDSLKEVRMNGNDLIIDKLLVAAKDIQDINAGKKWTFTWPNGIEVDLHDASKKIVQWLGKFKEIGDIAVNYDPVHLALPWAAFRFLLQTVLNNVENREIALIGVEKVSKIYIRCSVYERLYFNDQLPTVRELPNIKRCLVEMYGTMLSFLAEMIAFFPHSAIGRAFRALVESQKDVFQSCMSSIDKKETEALKVMESANAEMQSEANETQRKQIEELRQMLKPLELTHFQVTEIHTIIHDDRYHKMLKWLSSMQSPAYIQHRTAKQPRNIGTCQWLLKNDKYNDWQQQATSALTSNILWLRGIPGSGKTVLTSMVVDNVEAHQKKPLEAIAYFYCNRTVKDHERVDHTFCLGSLVRQLAETTPSLPDFVLQDYKAKTEKNDKYKLSFEEYTKLARKLIETFEKTTIIIDAVDELNVAEPSESSILLFLSDIATDPKLGAKVKIFVSSRPKDFDVEDYLKIASTVDIKKNNKVDIDTFVRDRISKGRFQIKVGDALKDDIIVALTADVNANCMFLWASLQIKTLLLLQDEDEIRKRLKKMPKDLDTTYKQILDEISSSSGSKFGSEFGSKIAIAVLRWTMGSLTPLKSKQLLGALKWSPAENIPSGGIDQILRLCGNLIILDETSNVFTFIHLSVQEYLETEATFKSDQNHLFFTISCLRALTDNDPLRQSTGTINSFRDHALLHWPYYGQQSQENLCLDLWERFFDGTPGSINYFKIAIQSATVQLQTLERRWNYKLFDDLIYVDHLTSVYYSPLPSLAYFGFYQVLCKDDRYRNDLNVRNKIDESLIYLASLGNHSQILLYLIKMGADVNTPGGKFGFPLQAAAVRGNIEAMTILIENGADINACGGRLKYALQAAASCGSIKAIELLLKHKAKVDVCGGGIHANPLQAAVISGNTKAVEALIKAGADVNAEMGKHGTALQAAAFTGNSETIAILLKHDAKLDALSGKYGWTALQVASARGKRAAVVALLNNGADVNIQARGGEYCSALQAAALIKDNVDTIKLLLDHGARVNAEGGDYGNVLQAASFAGDAAVIDLLLNHKVKADVNAQAGKFGNALQAAACKRCNPQSESNIEAIRLLLAAGANVNAKGGRYGNALQAAASWTLHGTDAIQLLLDAGADVNADAGRHGNPLYAAALFSNLEAIELFLENGADVNAQGGEFGNALQAAASTPGTWPDGLARSTEAVKILLRRGADIQAEGGKYGNALLAAVTGGNLEVVKILLDPKLDKRADMNAPGNAEAINAILEAVSAAETTDLGLDGSVDAKMVAMRDDARQIPAQVVSCAKYIKTLLSNVEPESSNDESIDEEIIQEEEAGGTLQSIGRKLWLW